ncbi:SH3 domain-binding protein 5-like isoform X1 [Sander lucioperca]|uniref:SH3 domain-binding protein 5-like isoform X1 n=1 Tax=Sander lucioperca TaxID=283035 RepID=UPI00125DE090|nr:SH3 domain-binding protein 5-like isoform X1 [Sander lucioperca]
MDPLRNGNNCEEDSQCAEVEEEQVDPRIQGELEKLNQSTDDINRWESELEDCRQRFRAVLVEATVKLDEQVKRIGRAVDDSKPYWEARKVARQAQVEAQKATQEFQRAVEILRAAKETISLAEERLLEEDSRQFDSAWQEMLNHATQRVMEAEQARTRSEAEHRKTAANYNSCISHMRQLEKKLKRSINKSRPYFELKAKYYLQLEQLKRHVDERQAKLVVAKANYRAALRNLESISEEIHAQRRSLAMGTREQGVGAEGDGGNEDIANFKMESDGLSMVSVSIDEEGSHSCSSEEETDPHSTSSPRAMPSSPSSSSSQPSTSASTPLDMPCPYPSSSFHTSCSYLSSSSSSSVHSSSCPGGLELASPCSSHDPDSVWGSGHASPLLGPRSQCSGASSPDCDQERGDRAEGAEATLEAGLNKLTLTVAQKQEGDSGDEQDSHFINPETSSPSSATTILLLNSV